MCKIITKHPAYIYSKPDDQSIPLTSAESGVELKSILDNDIPVIKNNWHKVELNNTIGWIYID